MMVDRVFMASRPGSKPVTRRTAIRSSSRMAGPEQNAEARKRAAMMAVSQ